MMKRRALILVLAFLVCIGTAIPASAANVFLFTQRSITLFEGESVSTALNREGVFQGDGEITYASAREAVATVSRDGEITGVSKGETTVTASLIRNGKRVGMARTTVKVLRAVTKVTLNTTRLSVYDPEDPAVFDILEEETEHKVLVLPAGSTAYLNTTCTPETASNRKVTYTSTDEGVVKITGTNLRAIQRGECDLTIASVQNPEVAEIFHVLVIQPVKRIQIDAGDRKVAVGSKLQLKAVCTPDNATISGVTWSSRDPSTAEVNAKGVVTGKKKGSVNIIATAADGSKVQASTYITVTQPVTAISFTQPEITVVNGRSAQARWTVQPMNANDRAVTWFSSDETIATVRGGQITGHKAGKCTVTCASHSNPEVTAVASITVVQLATKIECVNPQNELSLKTGGTVQLNWNVLPADTTNKGLTFKSQQPKIATVDENGLVRALSRGTATIVATSKDQGKRQGSIRINVIQPVTGVEMKYPLYYVQRGAGRTVQALVQPRNANNQKIHWSIVDEGIATIRSNGTNTGYVSGRSTGYTTVTAFTDDGGFTATARIRVGNFNEVILVEELYVTKDNQIKIALRNMSQDLILGNVSFVIECFDMDGNPMACNKDGSSITFTGNYPFPLYPLDRTSHGNFRFKDYMINQNIGALALTVTGWRDADGYSWTIPESERIRTTWSQIKYNP